MVYGVAPLPIDPAVDVGAVFGHGGTAEIELAGYDLPSGPWQPGDVLPLTLFWRAQVPVAGDYKVFVHLVDATGQIVAQNDAAPVAGLRPTSSWSPGEVVVDPHGVLLRGASQELAPGEYRLHVGIYLPATGERLVVAQEPAVSGGDSLFLTSVQVVSPEGE